VVERVLKRDMVALFGVRKINELEKLFIYLCLNTGGVLSVKTCASELGTTATTIDGYLELLENSHLIFRLAPSEVGGKKVLRQQYKFYLADAAMRNAVLLRGEEVLSDPDELGKVVESSVLRHLYAYHYLDTPQIVYWREARTNKEVDVIVKSPRYVIPVEVKYRQAASLDSTAGLITYCAKDPKVRYAYMVTREDKDFSVLELEEAPARILRIPAHIFTYLLGQAEHSLWEQAGRRA
jgi:predicted AAA+ superfamily ATPase